MSSGTIATVGLRSSESMLVHYVRKTGGGRDFLISNSEMNIKTETPRFDVIQKNYTSILRAARFVQHAFQL